MLFALGGDVRTGEQSFVGPLAERVFEDLRFSCDAVLMGRHTYDGFA